MACMRAREEPQRRSGRAGEAWPEARRESRQRQGRHHGLELDSEVPGTGCWNDGRSRIHGHADSNQAGGDLAAAPSADCLPADKAAAAIKEGFTSGTTQTGKAFAVKSKDYANAYMVAMSASTPESKNDALFFVTPDLENPGPLHSAAAVSALYANWPQTINAVEGTKFSAADHGVSEGPGPLDFKRHHSPLPQPGGQRPEVGKLQQKGTCGPSGSGEGERR